MELNNRFTENTMELLYLSSALDPSHAFRSFNVDDICNLAEKFYPEDFTYSCLYALRIELGIIGFQWIIRTFRILILFLHYIAD